VFNLKTVNLNDFNKDFLFFCYSGKLKRFIVKKGIQYISKGFNFKTKKDYWVFIRSNNFIFALEEWNNNAKEGIKAIN